jgi:hypothetical protein
MMGALPDRLPLVIGVTGHRDLRDQDLPRIEREVEGIIARLRHDYLGDKGETPIIVLSALAEGADRLVARLALAQGAKLIAPLPLPRDEYRRDFEPGLKPGNAAEFDALLAQAIAAPIIPFTPGNSIEAARRDPKKRAEQYQAVGLFIVQHCNILIAVWDGDEKEMAVGGSAQVIRFKRDGIPVEVSRSARASLDGSEIGPVAQILVPRWKAGSPAQAVSVPAWGREVLDRYRGGLPRRLWDAARGFVMRLFAAEPKDFRNRLSATQRREFETWESFEVLAILTSEFNGEVASLVAAPAGQPRLQQSLDALFDHFAPQSQGDIRPEIKPMQIAGTHAPRWMRMYTVSDTLAQDWQAQFKSDWLMLVGLAFAAFFCFAMFSAKPFSHDCRLLMCSS